MTRSSEQHTRFFVNSSVDDRFLHYPNLQVAICERRQKSGQRSASHRESRTNRQHTEVSLATQVGALYKQRKRPGCSVESWNTQEVRTICKTISCSAATRDCAHSRPEMVYYETCRHCVWTPQNMYTTVLCIQGSFDG